MNGALHAAFPAPPLVGRDREQGLLRAHLDAAIAGRGSPVLIGGEAGIGKTALAEALLAEARDHGALVLIGRCYDLSETPPYGPWAEVLERAAHMEGSPPPPDLAGARVASQMALFADVRDFLAALAAVRPLVLLFDDLHWADPASLDLLRLVARGLAELPTLLLATYRADELAVGHPLAALLPPLVREAHAVRLDLRALDVTAIGALVAARYALADADAGRLVGYLVGRTEGNALFVGELLRTLEGEGLLRREGARWSLGALEHAPVPPLLLQVIGGRLARLAEDVRRHLAVAAVIGPEAPLALWATVAGGDEGGVLAAAEAGVAARLLVELPEGEGIRFAHALVREALYEGVPLTRRRAWHRRAGEALAATARPDPDAVAAHFRRAGDPRAAGWLTAAGERAQRAYALITAAARYEAAIAAMAPAADMDERVTLTLRLALMLRFVEAARGLDILRELLDLVAADPPLRAYTRFLLGNAQCLLADFRRGLPELEAACAAMEALSLPEGERLRAVQEAVGDAPGGERGLLANWLSWAGYVALARTQGERALADVPPLAAVRRVGMSYHANAYVGLLNAYAILGLPDEARRAYVAGREHCRAAGHYNLLGIIVATALNYLTCAYAADDLAERRQLVAESADAPRLAGGARVDAIPRSGAFLFLEGRWDEARVLGSQLRDYAARRYLAPTLALIARARGDTDEARRIVAEALPAGPGTAPGEDYYLAALALQRLAAGLAVDAGDLPAARAWLAAHDRWLAWSGAVLGRAEGQLGWADYHRAAGAPGRAGACAEAALAHATDPRQPLALLDAHRLLGELDTAAGRYAAARAHLDAALALAEACAAPYERARTLLALAELRIAAGRPDDARAPLDGARAAFAGLQACPALARADALSAALETPLAPPTIRPFGLTAREAEVLGLVARGLTNAQIAGHLSLSPRTVDRHLNAVYTKLGVENRAAATRVAIEQRLA